MTWLLNHAGNAVQENSDEEDISICVFRSIFSEVLLITIKFIAVKFYFVMLNSELGSEIK